MLIRATVAFARQTFHRVAQAFSLGHQPELGIVITLLDNVVEEFPRLQNRIYERAA